MYNNQLLLQFLTAYMEWLYAGAPHESPFRRGCGLCGNVAIFFGPSLVKQLDVRDVMKELFESADLHPHYPFNDGVGDYSYESDNLACHLNTERKIWVYTQIERLKHEDSLPRHTQIDVRV